MFKGVAEKFKQKGNEEKVVTDLDAIIESPGFVRLHGKTHEIKPVLVQEFFAFANGLAAIQGIDKREKVTTEDLVEAYWGIIFPIVPTISKEDIRNCTQGQVAALVQLVTDHTMGKLSDSKKKLLAMSSTSPTKIVN